MQFLLCLPILLIPLNPTPQRIMTDETQEALEFFEANIGRAVTQRYLELMPAAIKAFEKAGPESVEGLQLLVDEYAADLCGRLKDCISIQFERHAAGECIFKEPFSLDDINPSI